ncbi:hypothetical protein QE152_g24756 [Popillia japonica]|uniref:Uncharacterized protein n=1 Tax=Popillia japonica TaxID=7064 RepID=A0AAW1K5X6_POPJA
MYLRACKRKWINDNINEIEKERANKNSKSFFKKIKEQKKQYKGVVTSINEKNGRVVEEESQYKNVWIEHFKGLLFNEAAGDESEGMDEESCEEGEEESSKEDIMQIISTARHISRKRWDERRTNKV